MKARIRPAVALGLVAALAVLSACTVRPLYSNAPVRAGSSATMSDELSSIAIKPVTTREAQEVRNRLIFLFQGGKAQPATPAYSLDLTVVSRTEKYESKAFIDTVVFRGSDVAAANVCDALGRFSASAAAVANTAITGR